MPKLFAPLITFVTEKIYQLLFRNYEGTKSIHISEWPKSEKDWYDKEALALGRIAVECIAALRKWKKLKNLSLAEEVENITLAHPEPEKIETIKKEIEKTMRIKNLLVEKGSEVIVKE